MYGNIKIRIGDRLYPENNDSYDNYTLGTVFFNLKDSFINKYYYGYCTNEDFGENEFNATKWHNGELSNVFLIDTTELGVMRISTHFIYVWHIQEILSVYFIV